MYPHKMDTTFISIHDLSLDARLLYASNSISDVLGYHPEEVIGKSCWEYFHPDEIPFAQTIHGRGIRLDKAAVLNYCQIKSKTGQWIGCECVFTVVHDVMVGCTSIYRRDPRSQKRAYDAPIIRQLFSSSPRDPRYHMLSYISTKFQQGPKPHIHEPRAALFLNRFTRTLTIMYATNGLEKLLGISASDLMNKSFYYCIQENCLSEAVRCLESAKANDSIAYLRFWYRDPRLDDMDQDEDISDGQSSDDSEDGGVRLDNHHMDTDCNEHRAMSVSSNSSSGKNFFRFKASPKGTPDNSRTSSGADPIFDSSDTRDSATSISSDSRMRDASEPPKYAQHKEIELEAVVSCTSDGLVVILRGARPFVPESLRPAPRINTPSYENGLRTNTPEYKNGFFASPWATNPIVPQPNHHLQPPASQVPPSYQYSHNPSYQQAAVAPNAPAGPSQQDFMNTIREVAVFAWALTGINGSLAQYSRGQPTPGAQPFQGLPVWANDNHDYDEMEGTFGVCACIQGSH